MDTFHASIFPFPLSSSLPPPCVDPAASAAFFTVFGLHFSLFLPPALSVFHLPDEKLTCQMMVVKSWKYLCMINSDA